jgi:hypothetical protein
MNFTQAVKTHWVLREAVNCAGGDKTERAILDVEIEANLNQMISLFLAIYLGLMMNTKKQKIEALRDYLSGRCGLLEVAPIELDFHSRKSGKEFQRNLIILPTSALKADFESLKGLVSEALIESLILQKK